MGVNDNETWVNLVSEQLPDVYVVNAGLPGYSSADVITRLQQIEADGYIYLITSNDADPPLETDVDDDEGSTPRAILTYMYVLDKIQGRVSGQATEQTESRFDQDIEWLKTHDDVLLVGFEGEALAERAGAATIPSYTSRISVSDVHADAVGNIEIAEAITPLVVAFAEQQCL